MEFIILLIISAVVYSAYKKSALKKQAKLENEVTIRFEVSGVRGYSRDSNNQPKGAPAKWHGYRESVSLKGHDIPGGLIFL